MELGKKFLGFLKQYWAQLFMMALLITLGIIFNQRFIKLLPCLVSLFVYYLDSKVNRFAKLLGACNCVIYSIGYVIDGLYGSVGSALLYSMPLQLITFFMWGKNKYKNQSPKLCKISDLMRAIVLVSIILIANIYIMIFSSVEGSGYTILQGYQFAIGLAATILIMFGSIEGMVINVLNVATSLYLYFDSTVIQGQINQITYLVMQVYTLIYTVIALVQWIKLYKEQHSVLKPVIK